MGHRSGERFARRRFLGRAVLGTWTVLTGAGLGARVLGRSPRVMQASESSSDAGLVTLFLAGDVMTGRGIDQALPHPGDPRLHEPHVKSAVDYVRLAERAHGPIRRPVDFAYVWGDALGELARRRPDARIVNLETSVTTSDAPWPGKGIHYRMHPANVPGLAAAGLDCCALANNHVLDWGHAGLAETLRTLAGAGIATAGAGRDRAAAAAPAVIEVPGGGRVLVFACGTTTSGIPPAWAATGNRPGVHVIDEAPGGDVRRIAALVRSARRPGDVVVCSIHWGGNWGHAIPTVHRRLAHALLDEAGVDVVHGHSSHHPKAIEVHAGKLVLYGCGDLLTDYEGIGGHEAFRGELGLMYFARVDPSSGRLARLEMVPTRMRRLRVTRADAADARWLRDALNTHGAGLGTRVEMADDGTLRLA
jgi:poly-gamma-glutamate synthesis protein (capsule biosynthesis protein)